MITVLQFLTLLLRELWKNPEVGSYTILADGTPSPKFEVSHLNRMVRLGKS